MTQERRPRFDRVSSPAIRLTEDDLKLISAVGRHRFLRSTHLTMLLPHRSPQTVIRRLAELYHAGYLDRPRAQINYHAQSGSAPIVYALGNKGAEVVAEVEHMPPPVVDWTDKNREAKRPYIEHALLLADLMVPLETASTRDKSIKVIDAATLAATLPEATRRAKNPWVLSARHTHRGRSYLIPVVPDAVFALEFVDGRRSYFYVEADRATMPISRSDISQSSYRRKLLGYLAAHKSKQYITHLGFTNLRVLNITTSVARTVSMRDAVCNIMGGRGSGLFLFINNRSLVKCTPLHAEWLTTKDPIRIDAPPASL